MTDTRDILTTIFHKLLQYMPHISIAAVLIVALSLLLLGEIYLLFKAAIILIPLFIISIVLIIKKKTIWNTPLFVAENLSLNITHRRLCLLYAIIFIATYIWVIWKQEFDEVFLLLITILYGITIVQIFSKHVSSKSVLAELILTTILFSYVRVFVFPVSFISFDILVHSQWIEAILVSGSTLPADIAGAYFFFRLYHIYIACGSLFSGLGVHVAAHLFHIPFIIVGSIFVYYIAKHLTKSQRISELATFSFLMIPSVLEFAVCIMPSVFAVMAFLIILYLFFMDENHMHPALHLFLGGFFTFYMTLVHHMTLPLVFFFMAVIIFSAVLYKHNFSKIQRGIVILFYTIPILYFMYTYLSSALSSLTIRLFTPEEAGMQSTIINIVETFNIGYWMNTAVSAIMLILLFCMIYYLAPKFIEERHPVLIFLPMTVLFLIFFLQGITDISTQIVNMLQVIRWRLILAPFFAVGLGIGFCVLLNLIYNKSKRQNVALIFTVCLCILLVVSSPVINEGKQSTLFAGTSFGEMPGYFNDNDLMLFDTLALYIPDGSDIYSDHLVNLYYSQNPGMDLYDLPYYNKPIGMALLFSGQQENIDYPYVVFRHNLYLEDNLYVRTSAGDGNAGIVHYNDDEHINFNHNTYKYNIFYENGKSSMYVHL